MHGLVKLLLSHEINTKKIFSFKFNYQRILENCEVQYTNFCGVESRIKETFSRLQTEIPTDADPFQSNLLACKTFLACHLVYPNSLFPGKKGCNAVT